MSLITLTEGVWLGDVDSDAWDSLLENRGGCCCHLFPPCYACTEPPTEDELNTVGYTWAPQDEQGGAA